ncbi:MAG: LCCL domain-containing protein [Planctomycetota bacterium]
MFDPFDDSGPNFREPVEPLPEAQKILLGLLSELPEEAQTLIGKIESDLTRLRDQAADEVAAVRNDAAFKIADIEAKADQRERAVLRHSMDQLEPLQKSLFRAGDLGAALATFVQTQALKARLNDVLPDPGNLLRFEQIGKSFCFRVQGKTGGPVWGTDVYTSDSHLATAAVHAGVVENGDEAVVKATMVDLTGQAIRGSMRHGVMTHDWGPYRVGYRLCRGE